MDDSQYIRVTDRIKTLYEIVATALGGDRDYRFDDEWSCDWEEFDRGHFRVNYGMRFVVDISSDTASSLADSLDHAAARIRAEVRRQNAAEEAARKRGVEERIRNEKEE